MHGTQELAATVATSFLRVTLVPIIDLDVIQFAADTVTAATSAPAPDPCRSLAPTPEADSSAGGNLQEPTSPVRAADSPHSQLAASLDVSGFRW